MGDGATSEVQEVPLTDQDLFELGRNPDSISSDEEASRYIWVIAQKQKEIERLKAEKRASKTFWDQRISSVQSAIDFLEARVEAYVEATGENSISTRAGRAYFRTRDKVRWPSNEEHLIDFCRERDIDLRVTVKPDKRKLKAWMKDRGEMPPGTRIEEVTSFHVTPDVDGK
jgi:hypothetical protein